MSGEVQLLASAHGDHPWSPSAASNLTHTPCTCAQLVIQLNQIISNTKKTRGKLMWISFNWGTFFILEVMLLFGHFGTIPTALHCIASYCSFYKWPGLPKKFVLQLAVWRRLLLASLEETCQGMCRFFICACGRYAFIHSQCQLFCGFCWKLLSSAGWQQSFYVVNQHFSD